MVGNGENMVEWQRRGIKFVSIASGNLVISEILIVSTSPQRIVAIGPSPAAIQGDVRDGRPPDSPISFDGFRPGEHK
jgi:hypothetical protein